MAQTLKFGNGTWATKKGSTLAYNDENGNYKPLPFTYTGAGKGTRVNKQGLIEVVENDRPRIDYLDSEDGALLLEPQSTNLLTYSQDFTQWATNATITPDSAISPDGTQNATLFSHSGGSFPQVALSGITFVSGADYVPSLYVKSDGTTQVQHSLLVNNVVINFTPTNEWVRISDLIVSPDTSGSFVIAQNSGSAVAASFYIWGAQLEEKSYATSYIPTQGTIQTRVAETASGSGNSEVFNSSEGVLMAETKGENDGTFNYISLSDGGITNYAAILYTDNDNQIIYRYYVGGSGVQIAVNSINVTSFNKIAIKWKANDFAIWINGFEVGTASSGNLNPSGTFNELSFARGSNNTPFYGSTKEISYYDEILTDLELETLTSYRTWESMVKELNLNVIYNG